MGDIAEMMIEFIEYDDFFSSTDSRAVILKENQDEVRIGGVLSTDELQQILSKMKELQGENNV